MLMYYNHIDMGYKAKTWWTKWHTIIQDISMLYRIGPDGGPESIERSHHLGSTLFSRPPKLSKNIGAKKICTFSKVSNHYLWRPYGVQCPIIYMYLNYVTELVIRTIEPLGSKINPPDYFHRIFEVSFWTCGAQLSKSWPPLSHDVGVFWDTSMIWGELLKGIVQLIGSLNRHRTTSMSWIIKLSIAR